MNATKKPNLGSRLSQITESMLGVPTNKILGLLPGLILAALLAWIAIWLSGFFGVEVLGFTRSPISSVMVAILIGLAVGNLISLPDWVKPGLTFSVRKLLRLGIILLGIRLSILDVFRLGVVGIPIVLLCIAGGLFITMWISRVLKLPKRLGALIAVGTAICGVSAIVATGPAINADEEEVAFSVAVITTFGILATLIYPYLAASLFAGAADKAGYFLGTAIHDTSQVTGAALVYSEVFSSPSTLDVATVTKLVRNVSMALVIPFMAYYYSRDVEVTASGKSAQRSLSQYIPGFVLGFLAFAALRSIGDAAISSGGTILGLMDEAGWTALFKFVQEAALTLLVVALAAVGLGTRFRTIRGLGAKPFLAGLLAALCVGVISIVGITLMGAIVNL